MLMGSNDKKQTQKNKTFRQSARHALTGIIAAFASEKNLQRDLLFAVLVLALGLLLRISRYDWVLIFVAIFMVMMNELWNTVIESLVDLTVGNRYEPLAKRIKDISAGTVLLTVFFVCIIGAYVFIPHIWQLIIQWLE